MMSQILFNYSVLKQHADKRILLKLKNDTFGVIDSTVRGLLVRCLQLPSSQDKTETGEGRQYEKANVLMWKVN